MSVLKRLMPALAGPPGLTRRRFRHLRSASDAGQMAVELVVVIPVVLILAMISVNLVAFMADCARFDRLSAEAVRVLGVSPGYGGYSAESCEQAIKEQLESSFSDSDHIEIEVDSVERSQIGGGELDGDGLLVSLIPSYREYTCTMEFTPPFFPSGIFGVEIPSVSHSCSFVVDPFEPGGFL